MIFERNDSSKKTASEEEIFFKPSDALTKGSELSAEKKSKWLYTELKKSREDLLSFLQKVGSLEAEKKISFEEFSHFCTDLQEIKYFSDFLIKNYKKYPLSHFTLKSLQEKRAEITRELECILEVESIVHSLSFYKDFLLSENLERDLRQRIANSKEKLKLNKLTTPKDLDAWTHLVPLLLEIEFTSTSLQLLSRLTEFYESQIQKTYETFLSEKKTTQSRLESLENELSKLKVEFNKTQSRSSSNWYTKITKSLQHSPDLEVIRLLEGAVDYFSSISNSLPSKSELENKLQKLQESQRETAQNLLRLKAKWEEHTSMGLKQNRSTFFQIGKEQLQVLWDQKRLDEHLRVKKDFHWKLKKLEQTLPNLEKKKTHSVNSLIKAAQQILKEKNLKQKKLLNIESRLVKVELNASIRLEIQRKREATLYDWKKVFKTHSLQNIEMYSREGLQLIEKAKQYTFLHDFIKKIGSCQSHPTLTSQNPSEHIPTKF